MFQFADTSASVLITGESGTGKELIARNLHAQSRRSNRSFVAINCAALNPGILESELFGHGRGSFTGAIHSHTGLFEQADGGTLLLDEIGDIPSFVQAKLLRVLQDREVRRMGTSDVRRVNVRVVSATNADLAKRVDDGAFRLDLYYRLNVLAVHAPSLRERVTDIPELIDHFFEIRGFSPPVLHEDALGLLSRYRWPGNVRELDNEIERLAVLHPHAPEITPDMFSERIADGNRTEFFDINLLCESPLPQAVGYLEDSLLRKMLARTNWNKSRSARELGLSRQGLLKKIKRYGITREQAEPRGDANADTDKRVGR